MGEQRRVRSDCACAGCQSLRCSRKIFDESWDTTNRERPAGTSDVQAEMSLCRNVLFLLARMKSSIKTQTFRRFKGTLGRDMLASVSYFNLSDNIGSMKIYTATTVLPINMFRHTMEGVVLIRAGCFARRLHPTPSPEPTNSLLTPTPDHGPYCMPFRSCVWTIFRYMY